MSKSFDRKTLLTVVRYFAAIAGLLVVFVLLDFAIDIRPAGIDRSYRFNIAGLEEDRPRILRQDNLTIIVIKHSAESMLSLQQSIDGLQDPNSSRSRQPSLATNLLRSINPGFFVSFGTGTDLECPLLVKPGGLWESCGPARYDFAGRALQGDRVFQNLVVPDYNFSDDFATLTIRP